MTFKVHNIESAPEFSKGTLEYGYKKYGFIPNLWGVMAESPALLKAYTTAYKYYERETVLTPQEQQIVALTISAANGCDYCKAAHSMVGRKAGIEESILLHIKEEKPLGDPKLEALRLTTKKIVEQRGRLSKSDTETFFSAGYTQKHLLEVVLGVGIKILTNYTNHLTAPPVDPLFFI